MAKIIVKQIRSVIGRPESQRKIVAALGLGGVGKTNELPDTPSVRGMVNKIPHLVAIVKK